MIKLRERLSFANVMSVIALFIALGGTGLAASQLGKNTVGTKQLKKNAVTTAKIKKGAVTGAKINPATLGTVPSAAHAANADSATNSAHAANADTLNGLNPSDFLPAADVQTPDRILLNDPSPGDQLGPEIPELIAGEFRIIGVCTMEHGGGPDIAYVHLIAPFTPSLYYSVSGWRGASYESVPTSGGEIFTLGRVEASGMDEIEGWNFTAVGPNGEVVNISGSVEVNDPEGNCAFSITVIGP